MIPCPSCQKPAKEAVVCDACGADLRLPLLLARIGRLCFNRALEYLKKDDLTAAENQLCAASALIPLRFETHRALGRLRARTGRLLDAAQDLQTALRLAPEDEGTKRALAEVVRLARRERLLILGAPAILAALAVASIVLFWTLR